METRLKISKTLKGRRLTDKWLANIIHGNHRRPNKPEQRLTTILAGAGLPFRYCGDGHVIIDGLCPDFISTQGVKLLIEVFGDYWHKPEEEETRAARFAKYGFSLLVVWEHELVDQTVLLTKISRWVEAVERTVTHALLFGESGAGPRGRGDPGGCVS